MWIPKENDEVYVVFRITVSETIARARLFPFLPKYAAFPALRWGQGTEFWSTDASRSHIDFETWCLVTDLVIPTLSVSTWLAAGCRECSGVTWGLIKVAKPQKSETSIWMKDIGLQFSFSWGFCLVLILVDVSLELQIIYLLLYWDIRLLVCVTVMSWWNLYFLEEFVNN